MKRLLVLIMVICLLSPVFAYGVGAEPVLPDDSGATASEPVDMGDFVVGATSRLNGEFFTNMWGNNTCDIDVRAMIHGYTPVVWTMQEVFQPDPFVVHDVTVASNAAGNKLYMVALMEGLTYSDGSPITARDYAFSVLLHTSPEIEAIGGATTNYDYLQGYEEYRTGASNKFAGVRIIDELTFALEIKAEALPFFFELSMLDVIPYPISVIAPGCEVADDGDGAYIRNIDPTITEPIFESGLLAQTILDPDTGYMSHPTVVSGPYTLTSYDNETNEARFNINPYFVGYYDGQKPTIDNVVFKSVLPGDMIPRLVAGEFQLLNKVVSGADIDEGIQSGQQMVGYPRMGLGFISFACESGPAQFVAVRQAIDYSLDKNEFANQYLNGGNYGQAVYGYYGIGQWMYLFITGIRDGLTYETEEEQAAADLAWAELNLDGLEKYDPDAAKAKQLLIDDGWTLNDKGEPFAEGVDKLRHKMVDGELMPLTLRWGKMKDSVAAEILHEMLIANLEALGMNIEIEEVPFVELLEDQYYRPNDRKYDMMYLATNFIDIFDPYFVFNTGDEFLGHQNTTGYQDEKLEQLALELRRTEPMDYLGYATKWLEFQEYYSTVIPMIPIYSNIYFDFHTPLLTNYNPNSNWGWPIALLYARYGLPEEPVLDGESIMNDFNQPEESSAPDGDELILD